MKRTLNRPGTRRRAALGAAALTGMVTLLGLGAGTAGASPAGHPGRDHVALGDSYASGPLIPDQVDAACLRSSHNYPSLVAARTHARLSDVSCSGATTAQMTAPQGSAPPQLDALGRGTDLVTLSIGGNDIGFSAVIATCAGVTASDPAGAPCRAHFTGGGHDQLAERVAQTAPKVATVIRDIHRRSPHARVVVVGYPDLFPDDGSACTSASVPFAAGDFSYLRDTEKTLNSMLAAQARKGGATYVDTYTPTVGHDMCAPTGTRWIESLAPATPAAPAHPNALGEQAMAGAVLRTVARHHR
ncbi:SGNH/GDSL hydrolase family protein [Streptomyces sp. NPDC008238]